MQCSTTPDRLRRARWIALLVAGCCALTSSISAQDQFSRAKELYASASYEEALALIDKIPPGPGGETVEVSEIRILCLFGLGQTERAQSAIEQLTLSHPEYRPDPQRMSPSIRAQFEAVRKRVLSQIITDVYAEALAKLEAKDNRTAAVLFDLLLDLLDDAENDPRTADLRVTATGFRDLAKKSLTASATLPARPLDLSGKPVELAQGPIGTSGSSMIYGRLAVPPNAGAPAASSVSSPTAGEGDVYDASAPGVTAPLPLKPILPPASQDLATPTPSPGLFEIIIDETGRVESVSVRRSINPGYDALVLREARTWRYQPAMRNGKAVKFRKVIEIYTTPLASIKKH
jgi:TonB family protein